MGSLTSILGAAAVGAVTRLLADDAKQWLPVFRGQILEAAVRLIEVDRRDRLREEWASHVDDYPGELAKLAVSLSVLRGAAWSIFTNRRRARWALRGAAVQTAIVDSFVELWPDFVRKTARGEFSELLAEHLRETPLLPAAELENRAVRFALTFTASLLRDVAAMQELAAQASELIKNPVNGDRPKVRVPCSKLTGGIVFRAAEDLIGQITSKELNRDDGA